MKLEDIWYKCKFVSEKNTLWYWTRNTNNKLHVLPALVSMYAVLSHANSSKVGVIYVPVSNFISTTASLCQLPHALMLIAAWLSERFSALWRPSGSPLNVHWYVDVGNRYGKENSNYWSNQSAH